jgi:hypothetical protein
MKTLYKTIAGQKIGCTYTTYEEARKLAEALGGRVVEYLSGYAVQAKKSGPYWNAETNKFE